MEMKVASTIIPVVITSFVWVKLLIQPVSQLQKVKYLNGNI